MLPTSNWGENDAASNGSALSIADISVGEILEVYKDDVDLLKRILTAKVQEDKRRAAEEIRQAEQARLQSKYIDLQLGHRRSASHPVTIQKDASSHESFASSMALFSTETAHQEITTPDWLSSLQARISADDNASPSIHSCELTSPKDYCPVSSPSMHSRTHSAPFNSVDHSSRQHTPSSSSPEPTSSQASFQGSFMVNESTASSAPSVSNASTSLSSKQAQLDHGRVMEALRAKLLRANTPNPAHQADQGPSSTMPTTGILVLDLKSKQHRRSMPAKRNQ